MSVVCDKNFAERLNVYDGPKGLAEEDEKGDSEIFSSFM